MSGYRDGYQHGREEVRREVEELKALVKELSQALDIWADAVDDIELEDLIDRARRACR